MSEDRLAALRGIEALVVEDSERSIRALMAENWSWEAARYFHRAAVVDLFTTAVDRGAELCR